MTISTYAELRDEIAGTPSQSWSHRQDLLSKFDIFLKLTEQKMYAGSETNNWSGLRVREMITVDTDTLSTSVRTLSLPTGYIQFTKLNLQYGDSIYPPLMYRTPHELNTYTTVGQPCHYTVTDALTFDRIADVAYTLNRAYYAKVAALTSSNTTNDILTNYPDIYLYGCLYHAFVWTQNDTKALQLSELFRTAIDEANNTNVWGDIGPSPTAVYQGSIV